MQAQLKRNFVVKATVIYAVAALFWIFFSDRLLSFAFDVQSIVFYSTIKGFYFVSVTSVLLYVVLHAVPSEEDLKQSDFVSALRQGNQPLPIVMSFGVARRRFVLYATLSYAIAALLWIFFSDRLLAFVFDLQSIMFLSTLKGIFFVATTAAFLYFAMHSVPSERAIGNTEFLAMLESGTQRLRRAGCETYCLSIAVTLTMLVLHHFYVIGLDHRPIFILLIFPVAVSALLGGFWPGIVSMIIVLLVSIGMVFFDLQHIEMQDPRDTVRFIAFAINSLAICLLSELLRRSLQKDDFQRRLLDAVASSTSDAIFIKDLQGRYVYANDAACKYMGRTLEQVLNRNDHDLFSPETALALLRHDREALEFGMVKTYEEVLQMPDRTAISFSVTKGLLRDEKGQAQAIFGISRNITEAKRNVERLQSSEHELKEVQKLAGLANWEWDLSSNEHFWYGPVLAQFGVVDQESSISFYELGPYLAKESWHKINNSLDRCVIDLQPFNCDLEILHPNGEQYWLLVRGKALLDGAGKASKVLGTAQDITQRKHVELQLQKNEERLGFAIDATCDGIWDWDLETGHVYRSPNYYVVTCSSAREDTKDFDFFVNLIFPDDRLQSIRHITRHIDGETTQIDFAFRLASSITANPDSTRWIQVQGKAVSRGSQGKPKRIVGTISDITERRRVQQDLQLVLEEAGEAIWILNGSRVISYANPSAYKLLARSDEAMFGLAISELFDPEKRLELTNYLDQVVTKSHVRATWPMLCADGRVVPVSMSIELLPDGRYILFGRDLSEEQLAQVELQRREQQLARVLAGADQGYWDWNLKTNEFVVSARWESMLGYAPGEMQTAPEHWMDLVHPEDYPKAIDSIQRHLSGEAVSHEAEIRCKTKNGEWRWILTRGSVVERDAEHMPLIMAGTHTDITEKKMLELAQKDAVTVFSRSYEGIMVVNTAGQITKVNPAFSRITGYTSEEVVGQSPKFLSSGRHDSGFYEQLWRELTQNDFWHGELWNRRKSGEVFAELLSISAVRDELGKVLHYIGVFSDISYIKAHEEELDRIAHYDLLTGVPNRRLLGDRLEQAIKHATRSENSLAVCFLDLDGFKAINDEFGHQVGDQLLIGVTHHLRSVLRANDTLARLGGDEFVVLLSDITNAVECAQVLERILSAVNQPIEIDETLINVTASIGVSLFPDDNADSDSLLRHADQAMYLAKNAGKNRFHLFDPESDRQAQVHRIYLEKLKRALECNEFVLYYQPKVDLVDGRILGAEALIRWRHPERGIVPPAEFLSHIHGSSLEKELGEWVIEAAMTQGEAWHRSGTRISISVNVSADHLLQSDFCERLQRALERHLAMPPQYLELEVLETAAIADIEKAVEVLQHCHDLGIRFALDDFGTGYSSLTYLRKLPIDTLKIDQSFVRSMLTDSEDLEIVEGVIRLAKAFNREVIAEGVETLELGSKLVEMGCRLAQGYGIARPMPSASIIDWAQAWEHDKVWLQLHKSRHEDQKKE